MRDGLIGVFLALKGVDDGADDDFEIEKKGPVLDIPDIVFDALLHFPQFVCGSAIAVYLRPAGNAGANGETGNYVTAIYLRGVTTITGGPAEINVGNNSVEITAGQQPDDASIDPYVQIGKFGEGVYLLGDIYINNVRPYYTAGDTVTIERMYCAGGVTGSGTNLYFYIPLAKPLIGVSAVTISNPTKAIITARKVEGGYIAQDATVSALGTPSCVPYENGVTIAIKASSAYNTKNNTPVTVTPENLVLKFT